MAIPPDPILRAAIRWLERLPASGAARLRTLFTVHRDFSDITPTQYEAAYGWLRDVGLLGDVDSTVPAHIRIFSAAIAHSRAPWLPDADALIRSPQELPEDARRAAATLNLSDNDAFGQLARVWGKVDAQERARIGTAGELALIKLLEASPGTRIDHVAAWSDGFGYDIAVHGPESTAHLEVKSTTRRSRLTVYLSRHEYETMCRDSNWRLIAVRLTPDLKLEAVATVPKEWIARHTPADRGLHGRWESCRLNIPPGVPRPGIPCIRAAAKDQSSLLDSPTAWPG